MNRIVFHRRSRALRLFYLPQEADSGGSGHLNVNELLLLAGPSD